MTGVIGFGLLDEKESVLRMEDPGRVAKGDALHVELRCAGVAGDDAVGVVVDGNLSRHGSERVVELQKSNRLGMAERDVEKNGEDFLLEETRVELKRCEESGDEAAPPNALLEVLREHVGREIRRHAVPPI